MSRTPNQEDFVKFMKICTTGGEPGETKVIDYFTGVTECIVKFPWLQKDTNIRIYSSSIIIRIVNGKIFVEIPKNVSFQGFVESIQKFYDYIERDAILEFLELFGAKDGQDGLLVHTNCSIVAIIDKKFGNSVAHFMVQTIEDLPHALRMMGYSAQLVKLHNRMIDKYFLLYINMSTKH